MFITDVISKKDKRKFIDFPKRLYKDDPNWICPLDNSIENLFNPSKNHSFKRGEAIRWILLDNSGEVIGRVAAFTDSQRSKAYRQPTGGMGYFEVVEDKDA